MATGNLPALDTYQTLVSAFTEFLTVVIHLILYERDIYPRESFLRTRKYDFPVQQNRHPKVCKWITDAVAAVGVEMLKCTVRQTSIILFSSDSIPLERYIFSTHLFPVVHKNDVLAPFESRPDDQQRRSSSADSRPTTPTPQQPAATTNTSFAMVELTTQFAAVLSRISTRASRLKPLPQGCSFTVAIELRQPPIGQLPWDNNPTWLPSEPGLQPTSDGGDQIAIEEVQKDLNRDTDIPPRRHSKGEYLGGARTTAIRSVEAGPFVMEVWVEEGKDKLGAASAGQSSQARGVSKTALHANVEDEEV